MRSGANQMQVVAIDLVEKQPIRLYVTVAEMLPLAAERMVLVSWRQRISLHQKQNHLAQLCQILAALLCEFDITPELRSRYRVPHGISCPGL